MASKQATSFNPQNRSFLSELIAKLQLTYYQYSVTLPIYGLHPIEKFILNILVVLSVLVFFRLGLYLLGIAIWMNGSKFKGWYNIFSAYTCLKGHEVVDYLPPSLCAVAPGLGFLNGPAELKVARSG